MAIGRCVPSFAPRGDGAALGATLGVYRSRPTSAPDRTGPLRIGACPGHPLRRLCFFLPLLVCSAAAAAPERPRRVLLTGAFGDIGSSALRCLDEKGYSVTAFDVKTPATARREGELSGKVAFVTHWGDLTDPASIEACLRGGRYDAVIHLAAILPPLSESEPELAREVNVGGTRKLVEAVERLQPDAKFLFASSVSVHGPCMHKDPPIKADDPLNPTDTYSHTKVECEGIVRGSKLSWTIFRFGPVSTPRIRKGKNKGDFNIFTIPYEQRAEIVHTYDAGLAVANAVAADTTGKTLLIGGGKRCRMMFGELIDGNMDAMGIGTFDRSLFRKAEKPEDWYYIDFMDTTESQSLLSYQRYTLEDRHAELRKSLGIKRYFIWLMRPIIRRKIMSVK